MTLLTNQPLAQSTARRYHIEVPTNPPQASVPAIIVFHGGGQDVTTIAERWGVDPPNPVPTALENYLLVFPESDPGLGREWIHHQPGDSGFPTLDLRFVRDLLTELTTRQYPTGGGGVQNVTADPNLLYAAGFSNGGGMVWQLLNSDLSPRFQGFAAVGKALDPVKAVQYRRHLAASGAVPAPAPMFYLQGTAEVGFRPPLSLQEPPLDHTLPFHSLREMLQRNAIPVGPATTRLAPSSTGVTEVVIQLFQGAAAYVHGTVVNGGHNWATPTTRANPPVADHVNVTSEILAFWHQHAGLP